MAGHKIADLLIGQNSRRFAISNDFAAIECQNARDIAFDHIHVMFDKQHGHAMLTHGIHDRIHQVGFFIHADTTGRFIKQQHLRIADQRHGDINQFTRTLRNSGYQ